MNSTKRCSKCQEEKPATSEFFYKEKKGKYGLRARCKECVLQERKDYHKENKDKILARKKVYQQENAERIAEYQKQYRKDNKERMLQLNREWRENNQERYQEYMKEYYEQHYQENKAYYVAKDIKRRKKRAAQTPDYANINLMNKIYAECPEGYHVDHMIPLANGGLHWESNLCYLPAEINLSKGSKRIEEFGTQEFCQHVIYWQDLLGCAYNSLTESV